MPGQAEQSKVLGVRDRWAQNGSIRLHYLESNATSSGTFTPLVLVPGALQAADVYLREMESLAPRRCVSISLRGRGKSDTPETGYKLENHVADIEAVIKDSGLVSFCLMAYSMGVPYAVEYASRQPPVLRGLILGDYRAHYPRIGPKWVDYAMTFQGTKLKAAQGIRRDSADIPLWDHLSRIECPVLILRGGQIGGGSGSLLPEEKAKEYLQSLRNARVVVFKDSGHDLSRPDYEGYIKVLKAFLGDIDSGLERSGRMATREQ
jgi:pimeloyl-ACP methyl ester carboxylesterase